MKKIISVFLVVLMLFALTACNGDEMQSKIDELEAKLMQSKIDELEAKLNEQTQIMEKLIEDGDTLKQEKDRLVGELAGMEEENNQQQEFIDTILNELVVKKVDRFRSKDYSYYSEPTRAYASGYKFLKILYNKENVKIKFYGCHSIENEVPDDEIVPNYAIISAIPGYLDEHERTQYYDIEKELKKIDNFESSNYYREQYLFSSPDEMVHLGDFIIPQELFMDEEGFVYIQLQGYFLSNDEYKPSIDVTSMFAFYKKAGDYIVLSTEPF